MICFECEAHENGTTLVGISKIQTYKAREKNKKSDTLEPRSKLGSWNSRGWRSTPMYKSLRFLLSKIGFVFVDIILIDDWRNRVL